VAVHQSDALQSLKLELENALIQNTEFGIKKENRPFHPHVTLATRDLPKRDFFDAWPQFEHKPYEVTWQASGISVLRHNRKSWDVWHTATFGTTGLVGNN
jgi:2'-5' RNA ligase